MHDDPVVAEVRKYRSDHTAKYGHDLDRIREALRERQNSSGRKVVSLPPRLQRSKQAANLDDSSRRDARTECRRRKEAHWEN